MVKKIFSFVTFAILSIFCSINVTASTEKLDLNGDGKINVFDAILMRKDILRMDSESLYNISDLVFIEKVITTRDKLIGTAISAVNFNTVSDKDNEMINYVFKNYVLISVTSDNDRDEISFWFTNDAEEIILIFPKYTHTDSNFITKIASVPLSTEPEIIYSVECDTNGIYGITAIGCNQD